MLDQMTIRELLAELANTLKILERNVAFFQTFKAHDFPKLGQTTASAMVLSQIFVDFYTCVETAFLRINHAFENTLEPEAWHKKLLRKMMFDISGVRPSVISEPTYLMLSEILRFRHFRRYYFDFDYDWDRLALVEKKYIAVFSLLQTDLSRFEHFLRELIVTFAQEQPHTSS